MNIEFDDLVKMIESLVGNGARHNTELDTLLESAFNQPVDPDLLLNALEALQEKYSEEWFGIEFCYIENCAFFRSRSVDQILSDRYRNYGAPIDI